MVPVERVLSLDTTEVSTLTATIELTVTIETGPDFQVGGDGAATVEVRQSRSGCDVFAPPVTAPTPVPASTPLSPHVTG